MKRIVLLALVSLSFLRVLPGEPASAQEDEVTSFFSPEVVFGTDDRVPVNDPAVGRIVPLGCTGWIVSNGAFLTAGHCVTNVAPPVTCPTRIKARFSTVQFNVPLSQLNGTKVDPPADDQYPIDRLKVQCELVKNGPYTKDWAVFAVGLNGKQQYAIEKQKAFFRVANLENLLPANLSSLRVTGYGVDGPPPTYGKGGAPRNQYNQTEQTAAGKYLGAFRDGTGFVNLRYVVDSNAANSGSPVVINGTSLGLGVHDGGNQPAGYNYATSFQLPSLASALHAFPGTLVAPAIPGANIYYVDAFSVAYSDSPTGNLFLPFPTLTAAFNKVSSVAVGTATLVSVVTGGYPEGIDETTTIPTVRDLTVDLKGDSTLVLPVGDVTLWNKVAEASR